MPRRPPRHSEPLSTPGLGKSRNGPVRLDGCGMEDQHCGRTQDALSDSLKPKVKTGGKMHYLESSIGLKVPPPEPRNGEAMA